MQKSWNEPLKRILAEVLSFCRIYWKLGRRSPPWTYFYRCLVYQRKMRVDNRLRKEVSLIGVNEPAVRPDNSAELESGVTFLYRGLDEAKALIARGTPVVFITWHQGAGRRNYALARMFPETAIFTRGTHQYGEIFSYCMMKAKGLSLVKIDRFLREGRPIKYTLDGIPLGNTVRMPILGIPSDLSTAPIRIMRSVKGVRLIPVTCYYRKGNAIEVIFHHPHPPPEHLPGMSDREVIVELISFLERDLMEQAPEQVRWRILDQCKRIAKETETAVSS